MSQLREQIFSVTPQSFDSLALEIFRYQFSENKVYRDFSSSLGKIPETVSRVEQIPFLPVEVFKTHHVYASSKAPETTFTSSGTTGASTSRHAVADLSLYAESFRKGFELFYGNIEDYTIFALLPSYLEREGSSLIYMVNDLIERSNNGLSKFYLSEKEGLASALQMREAFLNHPGSEGKKSLLLGVTYALLDLAEKKELQLKHTIVMETGGMKGKRKEMVREELHTTLENAFGVKHIHSEYGMTELLSQAYSKGEGIFRCPPWMKILVREMNDPFSCAANNKTGGINVIDLANLYSCSFLATSDLGKKYDDDSFEVLGRFDFSDLRGCNLMVE